MIIVSDIICQELGFVTSYLLLLDTELYKTNVLFEFTLKQFLQVSVLLSNGAILSFFEHKMNK